MPRSLGKLRTLVTIAAVSVHVPPLHPISASTTRSQNGPGMRLACHTAHVLAFRMACSGKCWHASRPQVQVQGAQAHSVAEQVAQW